MAEKGQHSSSRAMRLRQFPPNRAERELHPGGWLGGRRLIREKGSSDAWDKPGPEKETQNGWAKNLNKGIGSCSKGTAPNDEGKDTWMQQKRE